MDEKIYKGIFWWVENGLFCRKIWCDRSGAPLEAPEFSSKKGDHFNHKAEWNKLPKTVTGRKPYNYYPRGRVEIRRDKAVIYLNPHLNQEEIISQINMEFGLYNLSHVRVICDGSSHYQALIET